MLHNKLRRLPIAALALIFAPLAAAPSLAHEHKGAPEVFVDGELAIVHIDHANPALDTTVYHLVQEKAGNLEAFDLRFERGAPANLRSGQKINIRGRAVGRKLWVDDITASLDEATEQGGEDSLDGTAGGEVAGATQERSWIAVLVNITGTTTWSASDATAAENVMLHNTRAVDPIYRSASFGNTGFSASNGQVVGPVSVDKIAGCPYYSYASAANTAVSNAYGINANDYTHTIYIMPTGSVSDCNWLGLGVIGSYGSTSNRYSWVTRQDESLYAHELGHNYGWHHAATDGNNDGYDPSQSTDAEYADTSDTMGYCCTEKKFNPVHLDQAGWLDSLPAGAVVSVLSDGSFTLAPLGTDPTTTSDPQVLKIDKPDSGESYYLSYRQATGLDDLLSSSYTGGVSVHHGQRPGNWSYLIQTMADGGLFQDTANGLTIQQNWHDGTGVNITVAFDSCIRRDPSVALLPSSQVLTTPGGMASFETTVTNLDSAGCAGDNFAISSADGSPSPANLYLTPDAPNGMSQLDVPAGGDGQYSVTATATADTSGRSGTGAATLTVDTTVPDAPTNVSASTKKVRGQTTVQLKWSAPSDILGIASYRINRLDDGFSTTTGATQFNDSSASTSEGHSYEIIAIDLAGRPGVAANVEYIPGSGGGGNGNGGGNGGGKGRNK